MLCPVLIAGKWRDAHASGTFRADCPTTGRALEDEYPISSWQDCDEALRAATEAAHALRRLPAERIANFLEAYAERIERRSQDLVAMAHRETGLPEQPRLAGVELPRTAGQLRQAAAAAREGSWVRATIDTKTGIRSCLEPLGPVCVFGPNNFPFAFGSISGGDFAAAIAAGNPVIAKANSSHPGTTRIFAEEALAAQQTSELPTGTVQLMYRTAHADGERLVSDPRVGATGYTGSRQAGLRLKAAADAAGKPIYLELSSINPVVILPGALRERQAEIADEFTSSCLMGTGQFCTNPGLVVLIRDKATNDFVSTLSEKFSEAPSGVLLSRRVQQSLAEAIQQLVDSGVRVLAGHQTVDGEGFRYANTLLQVDGGAFLKNPAAFQHEVFGNESLLVVADDVDQAAEIIDCLEGNLTGCIYSAGGNQDDSAYDVLAPRLSVRVGRLLNDKMPTGVAVSPAMNHGGPYPATGHPGFTAVGIPAALERFAALRCYDNVRPQRLPACLRDKNPHGRMWRYVDLQWTQGDVGGVPRKP